MNESFSENSEGLFDYDVMNEVQVEERNGVLAYALSIDERLSGSECLEVLEHSWGVAGSKNPLLGAAVELGRSMKEFLCENDHEAERGFRAVLYREDVSCAYFGRREYMDFRLREAIITAIDFGIAEGVTVPLPSPLSLDDFNNLSKSFFDEDRA